MVEFNQQPIIMTRRGKCKYAKKVRNIQRVGGRIALIIHNETVSDITEIHMGGNHFDREIYISGVLINKKHGDIIDKFYRDNKDKLKNTPGFNILLEIDFSMHNERIHTVVDVFLDASEFKSYELLNSLNSIYPLFKGYLNIIPHYVTYESPYFPSNATETNSCIGAGKYCLYNNTGVNKEVIIQSIKQSCIRDLYGQDVYLQYMTDIYRDWAQNYTNGFGYTTYGDVEDQVKAMNQDDINDCYKRSFYTDCK